MTPEQMPPVPQGLREMLKDYPNHIGRLQESLNSVVLDPSIATPPFEVAIWELESTLEDFISEARAELRAAEESGNWQAVEAAEKKELLMLHSASKGNWRTSELARYFGITGFGGPSHGS